MSGVNEVRIEVENLLASLNYCEQTSSSVDSI